MRHRRGFGLILALLASINSGQLVAATETPMSPPAATQSNPVVLLHGLGLRKWAMFRMAHAVRRDGRKVINLSYPSRTIPVERLADTWLPEKLRAAGLDADAPLDFVTHSMGGIIVRMYRRDQPKAHLGRVVMLAPPNHGSAVVDHLRNFALFRWFTGVNGVKLGTGETALPQALGPWREGYGELGIIAGDRSANPVFSSWLKGPDDGKVAVSSTRLEGMTDFIVLHHSHTWMQWHSDTAKQVCAFLRNGKFQPVQ